MNEELARGVGPSRIDIAYERMGNPADPPLLLIMGGGAQMIAWPEGFCRELLDRGLQLVRFDNRDCGRSTHFSDAPTPDFRAVMAGDYATVTYTLSDMAADTVGLMDALGLEEVHLVGASMGGMIAQTIALEYPSRVRSLTSIMSSTGSGSVGQVDPTLFAELGQPPYDDREAFVRWRVRTLKIIGSPVYPLDEEAVGRSAALSWDRDHDPVALLRQSVAVLKSGNRTEALRHLQLPTLVVHGKADRMINVSGGMATAEAIPGARLKLFEGMGHGFPQPLWTEIADLIANHVQAAERARG